MGLGGIKLADYADPRAVSRGVGIAASAKSITARTVRRTDDVTVIAARVASASGIADYFDTSVMFGDYESRIVDYECPCPAIARFDGLCKHCVALVTAYFAQPRSFQDVSAARPAASAVRRTSEALARCLAEGKGALAGGAGAVATAGAGVPLGLGVAPGSVRLAVHLAYDGHVWALRLDAEGPRGTYVVRDVEAFAHRVQRGEHYAYGKKLAFAHDLTAFDEPSRAVARKMAEFFPDERLFGGSTFRFTSAGKREVRLREAEVASLLDAMGAGSFTLECHVGEGMGAGSGRGGASEPVGDAAVGRVDAGAAEGAVDASAAPPLWRIDEDAPTLALNFQPNEGGYDVRLSRNVLVVRGLELAFVLVDGVAARVADAEARAFALLHEAALDGGGAFIAEADAAAFCRRVLPVLEEAVDVRLPAEWEALRPVAGTLAFYFDKTGKKEGALIRLTVKAFYGEREVVLASPADSPEEPELRPASQQPFRDQALEDAGITLAAQFFDGSMTLPLRQAELAGELLYGGLAQFRAAGDVFTTPAFDRLIVDAPPRVQLGLSLAANLIQMDVRESDLSRDDLAAMLAAYRRRKRFHRMSDGRIAALTAGDVAKLAEMTRDLGVSVDELLDGGAEVPTYQAFYLDREYADAVRDTALSDYLRRLDEPPAASPVPEGLGAVLRPYQVEGFRWLSRLADLGFGGILADEMGLGKTLQTIALVKSLRDAGKLAGPALIACPASLVFNWTDEFARFAPDVAVAPLEGTRHQRELLAARAGAGTQGEGRAPGVAALARLDEAADADAPVPEVIVASYDRVRIDAPFLRPVAWGMVVLDEAQRIKNHATKTTRAVKRLRAPLRFALTGTPIENRLSELWSIFDFLMPGLLGSYERFRERYELGILGEDEEAAVRLRALVEPFLLRRRKADVLTDLPAKCENVRYVPLGPEQRRLYDGAEQRLREDLNAQKRQNSSRANRRGHIAEAEKNSVEVLAELTRLRQIALDPALVFENYKGGAEKLGAIMELVEEAVDAGRKVLVFSQFTSYLDVLAAELDRRGLAHFSITGATPKQQRVRLVNEFNADETPVFLVSLKAGGTGLNLTGASVVIHADPWWNAAATDQATDRAHRIGQRREVDVYKVVAKGTIEERIVALQQAKRDLADSVVATSGGEALAGLTRDRLAELLGCDE
ncbi:SNF2-related protein [Adlercreutzia sp. R21]|uniref:DEAD/DEAH box helicase n=1 Tax=Adlercreutzia wanghongyangiae TaxID=3111451 RepID=UPI002DC0223F|nr:SNF2-related protein [Adlercreutzia sp. R21]MEC4183983.1 SNF2-related protein [Adlercreutzia sp. R21]